MWWETLQIADWISFQRVHPLQLMHLFLYVSSARENWIMEVFWNVLLLPSESNISTCFHSPRTCLLFLYHRSLFSLTHTHTHTHPHFDAQLKPQLSPHQALVCRDKSLCAAVSYYWVKQVQSSMLGMLESNLCLYTRGARGTT